MSAALRDAWRARLLDYQIVQPTPQIERETFVRTTKEIGERDIPDIVSTETTRGRLYNLGRREWRATFRSDATEYTKELPCGALARFEITPPVAQGGPADLVHTVSLANCSWSLDRLPPIDYSELMRDLAYLQG
jgi:hypothetical protein